MDPPYLENSKRWAMAHVAHQVGFVMENKRGKTIKIRQEIDNVDSDIRTSVDTKMSRPYM